MDWMKILGALGLVLMLVWLWPGLKHMIQNSPKGSHEDWRAFLLPVLGVIGFVVLLVLAVRAL